MRDDLSRRAGEVILGPPFSVMQPMNDAQSTDRLTVHRALLTIDTHILRPL